MTTGRRDGKPRSGIGADVPGAPENFIPVHTFGYIDALAAEGRTAEARRPVENTLACRDVLGLLSGCIEANIKELWGNFPQTCSHVGRIDRTMKLSRVREVVT